MPALNRLLRACYGLLLCCSLYTQPAVAAVTGAKFPKTTVKIQKRERDDFILIADEVRTDKSSSATIALGKVQIVSDPYTLLADEVVYYKDRQFMTAKGHVSLIENSGETVFGDYMEFNTDASQGNIINFKMLFADNARLIARTLTRDTDETTDDTKTTLENVIFSPCNLCEKDPRRAPIWQMRASDAVHSTLDQEIVYHNAKLDIWGVPVFYAPYLSFPDPSVKQKAGFLTPSLLTGKDLGTFLRTSYYYPLSGDEDVTAELGYATAQGPLLGLEWRKRWNKAAVKFWGVTADSAPTEPNNAAVKAGILANNPEKFDQRWRGFLRGNGIYDINNRWRSGFDLAYAGDKTFIRQFKYSTEDILRNRVYTERFVGRSYSAINAYAFQDLRPNSTLDQPNLLPLATYNDYGNPARTFGGRWSLNSNILGVARPEGGKNSEQMERFSTTAGWQRQWLGDIGLKTVVDAQARGDIYYVQSAAPGFVDASHTGDTYSIGRLFPAFNIETSYPLVKQGDYLQYIMEPVVQLTATSRLKNGGIPNEDSQDIELDATNLFKISRYTGIDRAEDGVHITYGGRAGYYNPTGGYSNIFLGQSYRLTGNRIFPDNSGLENDSSDYVAQIIAAPSKYFNGDYRVRFSHRDFSPERHELTFTTGTDRLRLTTNYAYLNNVQNTNLAAVREQIVNSVESKLTKYWNLRLSETRNLGNQDDVAASAIQQKDVLNRTFGLEYLDECFGMLISAQRDYTVRQNVDTGDTIFVQFSFKNLGAVTSPTISPDFLTGNRTSTP